MHASQQFSSCTIRKYSSRLNTCKSLALILCGHGDFFKERLFITLLSLSVCLSAVDTKGWTCTVLLVICSLCAWTRKHKHSFCLYRKGCVFFVKMWCGNKSFGGFKFWSKHLSFVSVNKGHEHLFISPAVFNSSLNTMASMTCSYLTCIREFCYQPMCFISCEPQFVSRHLGSEINV